MYTLKQKLAPKGSKARPGISLTGFKGITIHETGNYRKSATAESHANYLLGGGANNPTSSHYYVDDTQTHQSIPDNEVAQHAGDGRGDGNRKTICLEICTNWGYLPPEYANIQADVPNQSQVSQAVISAAQQCFAAAVDNAALLAANILKGKGITNAEAYLYRHKYWSGKDCPHNIIKDNPYSWEVFKAKVQGYLDGNVSSGVDMQASEGKRLYVLDSGKNCQYFDSLSFDDVIGTLQPGTNYKITQMSKTAISYWPDISPAYWAQIELAGGSSAYTLALADRAETKQVESGKMYYVQAGAFVDKANALSLVTKLKEAGFTAIIK